MATRWDYTALARTYHKRPGYSPQGLAELFRCVGLTRDGNHPVADIGAGTGKLTLPLLDHGCQVSAVEPNDAMRAEGIRNTRNRDVTWAAGTGEQNGLTSGAYDAALFGSSFNVVDAELALAETGRILRPGGGFGCLWNHRDLDHPLQQQVEAAIRDSIPGYTYGTRREDPATVIRASGLFTDPVAIQSAFTVDVAAADWMAAWESHATLARQAGDRFQTIVAAIGDLVADQDRLSIPYTTRIWYARLK